MDKKRLPSRAGIAQIFWRGRFPQRQEKMIEMPEEGLTKIHALKGGELCLANYGQPVNCTVLFGTDADKSIFLTGVTDSAYEKFKHGGEETFFDYLKPQIIKELQAMGFGPTHRQGDIWLIKVSDKWSQALATELFSLPVVPVRRPASMKGRRILETRHRLTGETVNVYVATNIIRHKKHKNKRIVNTKRYVLVTGMITAPDHPLFDASDGIYAAARTENITGLVPPRNGGD